MHSNIKKEKCAGCPTPEVSEKGELDLHTRYPFEEKCHLFLNCWSAKLCKHALLVRVS